MKKKLKHPPEIGQWILNNVTNKDIRYEALGDFHEIFSYKAQEEGNLKAVCWYWVQVMSSLFHFIFDQIYWRTEMFSSYMKIAFRNLSRQKLYSFINIFGLSIGIAACMIIYLWVQKEMSFDTFHEHADRIYRIERELFRDNAYSRWPITSGAYKEALINDYPEILAVTRMWRREFSIKDQHNLIHRQGTFAVDNSIFAVFDFKLDQGDEEKALINPKTTVLTRKKAFQYFGTDNVIGKILQLEWNGEYTDFEVTGILQEIPRYSHVHFDMLISISSYPDNCFSNWRSNYLYTYVRLNENTSKAEFNEKLKTFVESHLEPHYGDLTGGKINIHDVLKMEIFPVTDIHLYPSVNWELEPGGSIASVYIFASIAVLILIIACLNFMNLSTARASKRAKEVGLRKTIGANQNQLRYQFLQESILLSIMAFNIAVFIGILFIPVFNSIFEENLQMESLLQLHNFLTLLGLTTIIGLFSGLYPAFYLTKFEPVRVLKGSILTNTGKSLFRRNMVIIQFVISITLIIGMFTIFKQMNFIQNRSLGFNKENIVLVNIRSRKVAQGFELYRNKLLQNPRITSVSASADAPGDRIFSNTGFSDGKNNGFNMYQMSMDYDFIDTYQMELLAGRKFSKKFSSDTTGTIMLNAAAVKKFGWTCEEAVGKELFYNRNRRGKVVGVVKDFNFKSAHIKIEPLVLLLAPDYIFQISIKIASGPVPKTIAYIKHQWRKTFPGEQFNYSFLDNRIEKLYAREMKVKNIFILFSVLSIFVASLGLLGLAVFTAEDRTKEIGVRKVLGASIANIYILLLKEFVKWIVISMIIASPIAYYSMNYWLQNFAFRISLTVWIFLSGGLLVLLFSLISISWQAIKAAQSNPVDSLKYE